MRPLLRFVLATLVLVGLLMPAPASAVTLDQVVALARAGVTDAVILALIDRDKTIFSIEPEQIVALRDAGVSEPVILAMLKSGREEGERAAQAASDLTAALILAERSPGPELYIPPDTIDGSRGGSFYVGPPPGAYAYGPTVIYGGMYGVARRRGRFYTPTPAPLVTPFAMPFRQNLAPPPAVVPTVPPIAPVVPPVAPRR
jgi:hypothetical protein